MSAFLVENKTIHKIITELDKRSERSSWLKEMLSKKLKIDVSNRDWKNKMGQRMLDLNQKSLGIRYGDVKRKLVYQYQATPCTKVQALKSLQCWLYQCAEGDIPEKSRLFKFFENIIVREWAEYLVMRTAEYDAAVWG